MARYTKEDLDKLGLKENPDGTFSKPKTVQQPREMNGNKSLLQMIVPIQIEYNKTISKIESILASTPKPKKEKKVKVSEPTFWKGKNIQDIFAEATANNYIFIPHNVPSSKNAKRAFNGIVMESLLCVEYRKNTDIHWQIFKPRFLKMLEGKEKPYRIEMFFIRKGHHRSDYHNIVQIVCDIMVQKNWLEDDNMDEMVCVPPIKPYAIDKHIPGIIIRVL